MRVFAIAMTGVGALLWGIAALLLAAWTIGRVATDHWHWTQYCYWLPSHVTLPVVAVGAGLGAAAFMLSRKLARRPIAPSRRERRMLIAIASVFTLAGVYAASFEFRWLSPAPDPCIKPFRVIHWNATSQVGTTWVKEIVERNPDLVVINPASYQPLNDLVQAYKPTCPPIWRHGFSILSKHRILRTAYTYLGIDPGLGFDPRENDALTKHTDPGRAMFIELDTSKTLGRNLVVWCLDLPSDISLWRREVTREAATSLAMFSGPVLEFDDAGVAVETALVPRGFPAPDLILGDLNIPRGSGSLDAITGGLTAVYQQAGHGPCATWPYRFPIWHLDQMFIAPWLRSDRYLSVDLGGGTHRGQLADLSARGAE